MKVRKLFILSVLFVGLCFTSCNSESDLDVSGDVASVEIQAMSMSDEVIGESDMYIRLLMEVLKLDLTKMKSDTVTFNTSTSTIEATATSVDHDSKSFPKTIILDFGSGLTGMAGYDLKGKLVVYMSDTINVVGSYKKITYDEFYVDNNQMAGIKVVTYKGLNTSSNPFWIISTKDTLVNGGSNTILNIYQTRELQILSNGVIQYATTGYAGGMDSKKRAFAMGVSAANPLINFLDYPFIVKGGLTINSQDKTSTVNYGDGEKDDSAVLTYAGKIKTISVK